MNTRLSLRIPGLEIVDSIGYGAQSIVYRARQGAQEFALKVGRPAFADPSNEQERFENQERLRRFYREAAAMNRISHPAIPQIWSVGVVDEHPYILMELIAGESLEQRLKRQVLSLEETLSVAFQLGQILNAIHARGLVHRDIKPANILLQPVREGTFQIRLIDFGFVTGQSQESPSGDVTEAVGTALYSAPEQIGLLNRAVDQRADLYSVGALLFECLAGRPLFSEADLPSLLRTLTADNPLEKVEFPPATPPKIQQLILELLAKDPDDRPSSARVLLTRTTTLAVESGLSFFPQPHPRPNPVRSNTVQELIRQIETVRETGRSSVQILQADPGDGKTYCALQLERELREIRNQSGQNTLVAHVQLSARFGAPLSGLIQILSALGSEIRDQGIDLSQFHDSLSRLSDLASVAHAYAPILGKTLFPEFQPKLDIKNPSEDAQSSGLVRLIEGLARSFDTIVVIIDDADRLDAASQVALKHALIAVSTPGQSGISSGSLALVLSANRSNRLLEWKDSLPSRILTHTFELQRLSRADIRIFCAGYLQWRDPNESLIEFIRSRAQGNLKFVATLLQIILEEGILRLQSGNWTLEQTLLERFALPPDMTKYFLQQLGHLEKELALAAQFAAIWGAPFTKEEISQVITESGFAFPKNFQSLVQKQFLRHLRLEDRFIFADPGLALAIEQYWEHSDVASLRLAHQKIGELLSQSHPQESILVAKHFSKGETDRNPQNTFLALATAGIQLTETSAYSEAIEILSQADKIRQKHHLPPSDTADLALGEALAETGKMVAAIPYLERSIKNTPTPICRAQATLKLSEIAFAQVRTEDAVHLSRQTAEALGLALNNKNLFRFTTLILKTFVLKPKKDLNPIERRAHQLLFRLANSGAMAAYFSHRILDATKYALIQRLATYSLKQKQEEGIYLSLNATGLSMFGAKKLAMRILGQARQIAQDLQDPFLNAYLMSREALCHSFLGEPIPAANIMVRCLSRHGHWLDAIDYLQCISDLGWNLVLRGHFREAATWISRAEEKLEFSPQQTGAMRGRCVAHMMTPIGVVLGKYNEAQDCFLKFQKILDGNSEYQRVIEFCAQSLFFHTERGELREIESFITRVEKIGINPRTTPLHLRGYFVFKAYALLALTRAAIGEDYSRYLRGLAHALSELKQLPRNPLHRGHLLALQGAYEALQGHYKKATELFAKAETIAKESDNPSVLYTVAVNRLAMFEAQNLQDAQKIEARTALELARAYGWENRVHQIQQKLGILEGVESATMGLSGSSTFISRSTEFSADSSWREANTQRYLNILLQVLTAATTVSTSDEQALIVLDECLKILSGERAMLFLYTQTNTDSELKLKVARTKSPESFPITAPYSQTAVSAVEQTRRPILISGSLEPIESAALPSEQSAAVLTGLKSILAVPLFFKDQLRGVLYLDSRIARGIFTRSDVQILAAIANQIAIMFEVASSIQIEAEKRALLKYARSLEETTQMLNAMIDSVGQGFLLFGPDGICLGVFSKICEDLLEVRPAGKHLAEVLQIPDKKRETFGKWIETLFSTENLFTELSALGPRQYNHSQNRKIELQYFQVFGPKEKIQAVVLLATDRTKEAQANETAQKEKKFAEKIIQIVRNKDLLRRLYSDSKKLVVAMRASPEDFDLIKRHFHTIKGNFGLFGDYDLMQWIHQAEDRVDAAQRSGPKKALDSMPNLIEDLWIHLQRFFSDASQLTNYSFEAEKSQVEIRAADLDQFLIHLKDKHLQTAQLVQEFEAKFLNISLRELLAPMESVAQEVALATQKKLKPLEIAAENTFLRRGQLSELLLVLPHLIRNSVVHGIEAPQERTQAGKAAAGQIRIWAKWLDPRQYVLRLILSDDGRGYQQTAATPAQKQKVNYYAGRGVGLEAVKNAVQSLGGQLHIDSDPGKGTRIQIDVPLHTPKNDTPPTQSYSQGSTT